MVAMLSYLRVAGASLESTTGTIDFQPNQNGVVMSVTTTGLGLGTTPEAKLHVRGNAIFKEGRVLIGTSSGNSTLEVHGSIGFGVQNVSDNVTLSENSMVLADTSFGNVTLTLLEASSQSGRKYWIKKRVL